MQRIRTNRHIAVVVVALIALGVAALAAGCSGQQGTRPNTNAGGYGSSPGATVIERNYAFVPARVVVGTGETVTFINKDSVPHHVKIDGQDLGQQAPGDSVSWQPTKAGKYPYQCSIHPSMVGTITAR